MTHTQGVRGWLCDPCAKMRWSDERGHHRAPLGCDRAEQRGIHMVTKKQLIKATVRYDAHIAPAIAMAAQREGLSQNEWIVSAIQAQLEAGQRERQGLAHTALLFERLHKLQRRMDGMMELFLVFTRFLFAIIPEVADGAQPRLNVLGKQRAAALCCCGERPQIGEACASLL